MDDLIEKLLNKDLREAAGMLSLVEIRYLVDMYYLNQENRKRSDNQVRALVKEGEPHQFIAWTSKQNRLLEESIKKVLDYYTAPDPLGQWCRSVRGIGPVITAGLLAHIDIARCCCAAYREMEEKPEHQCPGIPTVGHIWRYAGLDPTVSWNKGEKRPWNARLKVICWKIGESFVKVCNHPEAFYGRIYLERKALETARNEEGLFADQATAKLERFKIGKSTDAYKAYSQGKLPLGHIHARAKRYAVKLFLSHYHDQAYRLRFGIAPPLPYPISILGHAHLIEAPAKVA